MNMKFRREFFFCLLLVAGVLSGSERIFYTDGPTEKKLVSLTFDDGPGKYTEEILKILTEKNIRATFFVEGSQVVLRPQLLKKVFASGQEIGIHTYSHPNFYTYKKENYRQLLDEEIKKTIAIVKNITGQTPKLLRMPYGYWRNWVEEVAKENGLIGVNWTFGCDWKNMPAEELVRQYCAHIRPGAIFLMHDGGKDRSRTTKALGEIISEIQRRGYKIVPVGELLGIK